MIRRPLTVHCRAPTAPPPPHPHPEALCQPTHPLPGGECHYGDVHCEAHRDCESRSRVIVSGFGAGWSMAGCQGAHHCHSTSFVIAASKSGPRNRAASCAQSAGCRTPFCGGGSETPGVGASRPQSGEATATSQGICLKIALRDISAVWTFSFGHNKWGKLDVPARKFHSFMPPSPPHEDEGGKAPCLVCRTWNLETRG